MVIGVVNIHYSSVKTSPITINTQKNKRVSDTFEGFKSQSNKIHMANEAIISKLVSGLSLTGLKTAEIIMLSSLFSLITGPLSHPLYVKCHVCEGTGECNKCHGTGWQDIIDKFGCHYCYIPGDFDKAGDGRCDYCGGDGNEGVKIKT